MTISNNIPISHTKVVIPRRREELLTRPRLMEMMFDFLDKKLTLISAPAGYGKTSLLIDFGHKSELPYCWLSLDTLDQDPQRFSAYFIAALEKQFPGFGKQANAMLNTITSIDDGLEALVVTLVNEIFDFIPQHFVLVLDDYHLVSDIPDIQNFLSRFIQLVDENCHVIISSRTLTQLPNLPLMVARDMVGGLDLSELSFRLDEIQSLFAQNYQMHVSDDTAQELVDATEGWITGLQLSSLGIAQETASRLRVARAAGVGLFDYLGQQVLDQQSEDVRFFLLRSSLLEEFDIALINNVLGELYPDQKDWAILINTVIQRNLFALPVGTERGWVRYHHLFRDFLQDRLRKEHPEEIYPILEKLALAYEALSDWEKAYHIQKRLDDADALAGLIERAAPYLMSHAFVTLDGWVNRLPPSIQTRRPGILSIRGTTTYMKGNSKEGLELLNRAEASFRKTGELNGLALTLIRRATVHRFLGDYIAALHDSEEVLGLTESNDQMNFIYVNALRQNGLSLFRQGKSLPAVKILERALELYVQMEDSSNIPVLMMETGIVYEAIGKWEQTKYLYDQALKIWKNAGNLTWQANVLNNMGVLHFLQGEYDKAILVLEEGLLCAKRSGQYSRLEALLLISLGDIYAEVEDFELAHQHYQRGLNIAQDVRDGFLLNYLILARVNLSLQELEFEKAGYLLHQASNMISAQSSQREYGMYHLLRGKLSLHELKIREAIKSLEIAESCFVADGRNVAWAKSQLLLAAAYHQDGSQLVAKTKINDLLESGNHTTYSLSVFSRQVQDWLDDLQDDENFGQDLRELFERSQLINNKMPGTRRQIHRLVRTMEVPDAKLKIQTFGRTRVKVGGKLLTLSDWQTQSVRDLFFYFLMMKEPLTKEQIGEVFWPEIEEPSKLKMRFKNDIYRLRRAVGSETIFFENDLYSFNRANDFEYDVDAFEGLLFQAKMTEDSSLQIELLQRAVKLVNGHFLEDIDAIWIWPERERLDQIILKSFLDLAELLINNNQSQEALAISQQAIEHDPTFEAAYYFAMKLYLQMNDRVRAVHLYEVYTAMMESELDLPPSSEMEALYKRLIR